MIRLECSTGLAVAGLPREFKPKIRRLSCNHERSFQEERRRSGYDSVRISGVDYKLCTGVQMMSWVASPSAGTLRR